MSEMFENENADLFTLVDEDGVETVFEFVDEMEENGVVYYALIPYYDDPADIPLDEDVSLVVLKLDTDENGEELLMTIDDDDEYERIGNIFVERIQESFDAEDDEENE